MSLTEQPRFLLLEVINPHYHQEDALKNMRELEMLVETYGGEVVTKSVQHRVDPHPDMYVGPGKVAWLLEQVKALQIDVVVLNGIVKSGQIFRLEKALWKVNIKIKVWDRVDLILNIFEKHAHTVEAKLQIELARIGHIGPRIYGLGRTLLSRQGGGIGTRGAGETNIEMERRLIKTRKQQIQKKLDQIAKQKRSRLRYRREQGLGPVALVGYTSAGKTSLFNALTGKEKQAHRGLFTTLDTVVGKMKVPDQQLPILVSDTIGFIENLPPVLIDAFKSTLMESMEAELLLHVIDASDVARERKISVVHKILLDLRVMQPVLIVFNKIDLLNDDERTKLHQRYQFLPHILVSAETGEGLERLKDEIQVRLKPFAESVRW